MDHFVFGVILSCLLFAVLWSPAGKVLTLWLSCAFVTFQLWCPGPRVEFDCNDSLLPYFDLPRSFKLKSSLDLLS